MSTFALFPQLRIEICLAIFESALLLHKLIPTRRNFEMYMRCHYQKRYTGALDDKHGGTRSCAKILCCVFRAVSF
jgi:hypothetical protein